MPRSRCRVLHNSHLETALQKLAQMGLDAHVRQHAAQNDFADSALAQLQDEIIGLWPEHFVRADDNGFSVFNGAESARANQRPTWQNRPGSEVRSARSYGS
jgi:hypothetical protein